ncbi:MAG TPA: biotin transporter BioY [Thermosynechococcaceae cyanobacterium]
MSTSTELLWALIGLLLTIGSTFLPASLLLPVWSGAQGLQAYPLGVTYQVGAVLLVGCLGGKTAAVLSQVAYLLLGLTWYPVFAQGGGWGYLREPSFGYLLGFVPAAWICGALAFKSPPRLESLAFSNLCGLVSVHLVGIAYLVLVYPLGWLVNPLGLSLPDSLKLYSLAPLPGQFAVACAIAVLAFVLRRLMFY